MFCPDDSAFSASCWWSFWPLILTPHFALNWTWWPKDSNNFHLKLPSLFAAWIFWTFHNESHNMKALVILSHSWSLFLPLVCMEKINFCGSLCGILEYFLEKNLLPDYHMTMTTNGQIWWWHVRQKWTSSC